MEILVHHDGQQLGPISLEQARQSIAAGQLRPDDLAWHEGLTAWVALGSLVQQAVAAPPRLYPTVPPAPPTSALAIASLVLGIGTFFMCFLTGIPAVICGHMARGEIRRSGGRLGGDGMAVAGLVTGYLSLVIPALIAVGMLVMVGVMGMAIPTTLNEITSQGQAQFAENSARQVGNALRTYATDHGGKFPETLEELVPEYLPDPGMLRCPLSSSDEEVGYLYFGGTTNDPAKGLLILSKATDAEGRRAVVWKDGTVGLEKISPPDDPI